MNGFEILRQGRIHHATMFSTPYCAIPCLSRQVSSLSSILPKQGSGNVDELPIALPSGLAGLRVCFTAGLVRFLEMFPSFSKPPATIPHNLFQVEEESLGSDSL